jgi:hypothetical protein
MQRERKRFLALARLSDLSISADGNILPKTLSSRQTETLPWHSVCFGSSVWILEVRSTYFMGFNSHVSGIMWG